MGREAKAIAYELKEKIKVLVCGPPAQVAAIAGKKEGMKQGALGGASKELGYDESQVSRRELDIRRVLARGP